MQDGSLTVMETIYSSTPVLVNLVIERTVKWKKRERGQKEKNTKNKKRQSEGNGSSAVTMEEAGQWRSLSTVLFTFGGGH